MMNGKSSNTTDQSEHSESILSDSPFLILWRKYRKDGLAVIGMCGIAFMLLAALAAPLISNARPFILYQSGELSFPFLRYIFAPDSSEVLVEKIFNFFLIFFPICILVRLLFWKFKFKTRAIVLVVLGVLLLLPFIFTGSRLDKTDWREKTSTLKQGEFAVFAPIPYGPFETVSKQEQPPSLKHYFGTDNIGRDVLSRMVYGARVSLAVGFLATGISIIIGIIIGMFVGYFRGKCDLIVMRIVEIIICFPTFLLLLILMSYMQGDGTKKFTQSILVVIAVIGLTGWTGLCRLIRGEVLKQSALPYVQSCEALGLPVWRIMFFHVLPNVTAPVFVAFSFGVAGAILAESSLSFLGFGVQVPTASWGELLRQAMEEPYRLWHLTLWPGLAIFIAVSSFNFAGEGLRKILDPNSK